MAPQLDLQRFRKDQRFLVGGLVGLAALLTVVYYLLQRSRDLPPALAANKVLLFVLFYLDVVLILVILFVLLRNVFKLLVERQHRILGSKFKIKLVTTYIFLSLIPVLVLFVFANEMLNSWTRLWFDQPAIQRFLEQGYTVAQELNRRIEERHTADGRRVLAEISSFDLADLESRPELVRRLGVLQEEMGLDLLAVYAGTDFVHAALNPAAGFRNLPELSRGFLREALRDGRAVLIKKQTDTPGRLVLTALAGDGATADENRTLVAIGTLLDPKVATQTQELIEAFQGYRQLQLQQPDIEAGYRLTFLAVTLAVLLAFSWVGFYLARRVTLPIQALAEGTQRISGGDLSYRVEVAADDELGVLVASFNRMTGELERNEEELVATNRRLAEERAKMAAMLEGLAAGVVAIDAERRILTFNRAALQMLRQGEQEVIGRSVDEAWGDPERAKLAALLERAAARGRRLSEQLRLVLRGEWRTFEAKVTPMMDAGGERIGQVMVLEDLTQLIRAQQQAAWTDAARRVAHEIKNPLTPIKLSAERLLRKLHQGDPDLAPAIEEGVELIVREVASMQTMVDEFSRFARMPPAQPEQVDLASLIEETVKLYTGLKPGVTLLWEVAPEARQAWLDSDKVKRALINLLDNALAATEAPGEIRVSARHEYGRLRVEVADTGEGIPPQAREKLFLPHFSTKGRGTGLGLAIVHRIVEEHHGTIRVRDNEPRGTVFDIDLPQQ